MSWFGDTFGDSLNTLKGQITKITKEVLAEEETPSKEETESEVELIKELQAVCESKDLEISALKDEYRKLQNEYKATIESSKCDKLQCEGTVQLESELIQLRQERDHLNSCLDELQSEHQVNLDKVISIRDKYKAELEELKKKHDSLKEKLVESKTPTIPDKEVSELKSKIENLQQELEIARKDKDELVEMQMADQDALKKQLEKVLGDIQVISDEKQKTEECNKSIERENEELRYQLSEREKEVKENEIKIKVLLNEKEELTSKVKKQENVSLGLSSTQVEIEQKLKSLLRTLNKDADESDLLVVLENSLKDLQKNNEEMKETTSKMETELRKLKEENESLQNTLKTSTEKWNEMEKNFQQEISSLRISQSKDKSQDCINQSQTDDVKRLEQEIANFMSLMVAKNNEINDYSRSVTSLQQELQSLKAASVNIEEELLLTKKEKKALEDGIEELKIKTAHDLTHVEEKLKTLTIQNSDLVQVNDELKCKTDELEKKLTGQDKATEELEKVVESKTQLEKLLEELQKANLSLKNDMEHLKAQMIIKESGLADLMKANLSFQEEVNRLQTENNALVNSEKEIKKWKDVSVDLEVQREDLIARKEELEGECLRLQGELELLRVKDAEIQQLKSTNASLIESCNQLHHQLEEKAELEQKRFEEENQLQDHLKKQSELVSELQEENTELKSRIQKFQEQMKIQMANTQTQSNLKEEVQQHRRSKSAVDIESSPVVQKTGPETSEDVNLIKQAMQQEQSKYRLLQQQFQEISEKEANARKEFERLRQHLIEVEDHYTEEAVENEKVITDLKSKLIAAEEQLQNSSTLYTSLKVRDNQHLESLQSQIRLVSVQRDDLQAKLSAAEDEVQKHKASLMSLQIVLEQFQQDKEREVEEVAMKYEKQLQMAHNRFRDFETEIEALNKQLSEAKNGLKAASRLGEQLEKKSQQVSELEENLKQTQNKIEEMEKSLAVANQSQTGKIDKSLIKNLVVGYVLSPNGERKSQVLRIMASVLDLDQEEREKMGVDATNSGWLSNILHPKGGSPSNQSLSEAFIKFLENESRPQPQLKLVPEQFQSAAPKPSRTSPKPPARISELTLPTFNSPQENESTNILKNVLKDS